MWNEAWNLYLSSFPLCEQRPLEEHIKAMGDDSFHCNIITEDSRFVGLLMWWDWSAPDGQPFRFIEHFATDATLRGGGYGGRALDMALDTAESRIVTLEIDPPQDEISVRREGFYQRHGLATNRNYQHIHPSFRASTSPHELLVMSYPRAITPEEFAEFRRYNLGHVLKYVDK